MKLDSNFLEGRACWKGVRWSCGGCLLRPAGPLVPCRAGPWDREAGWLQVQPWPQQSTLLTATRSGMNSWVRKSRWKQEAPGPTEVLSQAGGGERGGFIYLMKGDSGRVIKTQTCRQACLGCVCVCISIHTLGRLLWHNSFVRSGNIFEKQHYKRLNVEQM